MIGMWGVAPVAVDQLTGAARCPQLGPFPACYVVFLCYGLTASSALIAGKQKSWLFFAGIIPLLILASFGSGMEVFGYSACPVSTGNVPMCFYALALALSLVAAFFTMRACSRRESSGLTPNSQQKV